LKEKLSKTTQNKKIKNYTTLFKILVLLTVIISCESSTGKKSKIAIDKKVDSLLRLMTLEEKIGQMNQYTGFLYPKKHR